MDEPVPGRLRPARRRGLTSPGPVTAPRRPMRPPARTAPTEEPDKPQNRSAAGKPHPGNTARTITSRKTQQSNRQIYAVDRGYKEHYINVIQPTFGRSLVGITANYINVIRRKLEMAYRVSAVDLQSGKWYVNEISAATEAVGVK